MTLCGKTLEVKVEWCERVVRGKRKHVCMLRVNMF